MLIILPPHCTFIAYVEVIWLTPEDTQYKDRGEKDQIMLWYEIGHHAELSIKTHYFF